MNVLQSLGDPDEAGVERVRVAVDSAVIDHLGARIAATRWPHAVTESGWSYGADLAFMKALATVWSTQFDWAKEEARINRFEHFRTSVDGLRVHFIHARSSDPNAVPLLLLSSIPQA